MSIERSSVESDRTMAVVCYVLHLVGSVAGVTSIVGLILNYVKRSEVRGTWLESHFRWQIRTFWFGLLWVSLCILFILMTLGLGILIAWLPLTIIAVWFIYRIVRGWLALNEKRPMYA